VATVPAEVQGPSDSELLEEVRSGSSDAYARLYERHVDAAYNLARQIARSRAEADDFVSEAFAKVLDTLRDGRGPNTAFRAYLLTALRHVAYDRTRRERKVQLADDVAEVSGADISVPFTDTAVAGLERTLAAQAFSRLPERWQTVLWHIEVEGQTPAQVAPLLGLNPNGVSALAYRAREGLRQAYLQVHLGQLDLAESRIKHCRATVDRLGAWTRGGLSKRETAQVEAHLDGCDRCRALASELADVNGALRVLVAPLVLGGSATGYLALSSSGGAATTGGAAAGGGVAGGGAADAASSGPRHAITAGVACGVLAAAVAIALNVGADQSVPVASAPPPAVVQTPSLPTPQPPLPPPAPRPPAPAPAPTTPVLHATGPTEPIQLIASGAPAALPIRVSNNGSGPSEPVTSTLSLPPGVAARLPSAIRPGPASTTPQNWVASTPLRTQAAGAPLVRCSNGPSTITCATDRGLQPGESFVFDYLIQADAPATGGEIAASISAGAEIRLRLPTVPVRVEAPTPVDGVDVDASAQGHASWLLGRVEIDVRNTGSSTGRAEAVAELPEGVVAIGIPLECDVISVAPRRIRCAAELAPGESLVGHVWLSVLPEFRWSSSSVDGRIIRDVTIPVTATLGAANDSDPVSVRLWHPRVPPLPPEPEPPTTTSTATSTSASATERPSWWPQPPTSTEAAREFDDRPHAATGDTPAIGLIQRLESLGWSSSVDSGCVRCRFGTHAHPAAVPVPRDPAP
jgi:RNA polymerase sigma factor (sigma-70 family)